MGVRAMFEDLKEGIKGLDAIAKAGRALIFFKVCRHPEDNSFDQNQRPCVDVYLVPHRPGKTPSCDEIEQHYKGTVPSDHPLEVSVDNIGNFLKRWGSNIRFRGWELAKKENRERKSTLIVLIPRSPWDEMYDSQSYVKKYRPGTYTENIYLKPKSATGETHLADPSERAAELTR